MTHKEFNRRLKMMDKVLLIKKDFKTLLPEVEQDKYIQMLGHLYWFHRNKKQYNARNRGKFVGLRKLIPTEMVMLDYLLKNNINPKTIYKWFLVCRLPEDILSKLRNNEIKSVIEARKIAMNRMRQRSSNTGLMMIEEIQNIVGSL